MNNIVVLTTDLSPESHVAFDVAREYATALKAEIHLLTVLEDPAQAAVVYAMEFPVFPGVEVQKQLVDKVKKELASLVTLKLSGVQVKAVVKEAKGSIHNEIIEYATSQDARLVVISTHGRGGLKSLLIGSVAERVARYAKCPVLVVPPIK